MPIGALSNPTTLQQLQAIGVLPMGGGISSPLPQMQTQAPTPLVPPQGPSQPFVSPDGAYVPPQAQPTNAQAAQPGPLSSLGRAVLPAAFPPPQAPPQPAPQAPPQPDLATTAQTLQAAQEADGTPGSQSQPDLYSGAKMLPSAPPDYNSTVPLGGPRTAPGATQGGPASVPAAGPQAATGVPPGPATATPTNSAAPAAATSDGSVPFAANNPLNIRFAGQDGAVDTKGFAAFATPAAGKAATDAQFGKYADRGVNTLRGLISTWAPPSENDTSGYISKVSQQTGIAPDAQINLKDPSVAGIIQQAMAKVEGNKNANVGAVQFAGPGVPAGGAQGRLATAQQASGGQSLDTQADSIGVNANEIASIARQLGYKPSSSMIGPGDSLLATGMALMGGRTFADSMANGSKALLASRGQALDAQGHDNSNALGIANAGVSMANTAANRRLQMANFALQNDKLDQQIKNQNAILGIRTGQLGVAQERVGDTTKRTDAALNGTAAQNATLGKKAGESIDELNASAGADATALANIQSARKLVADNPGMMGPTLQAQATRAAAMLGLGDTASLQAYEKMSAANRMEYLQSVTGGHVGGIRSNAELENIGKAVAQANTDPKAADYILSVAQNQLAAKMAFRQAVQAHAKDPEWQGAGFSQHEGQFYNDFFATHPAPQWDNGHGTASPAGAPSISSFWK